MGAASETNGGKHSRAAGPLLAALLVLPGGGAAAANFSQHAGFDAWRETARRDARLPTAEERALLARHRPRFLLPPGHPGLIDFYRDYVAHSRLRDGRGRTLGAAPDRAALNRLVDDPEAVLTHAPPSGEVPPPVVYGSARRLAIAAGGRAHDLSVLTWHAVFRHSGLPAGVDGVADLFVTLLADPRDWHQLDHYTAVTLVLDDVRRPLALMLQQHNYTRTWLLGEGYVLPADGRARVDVAVRSNELYPAGEGRRWRRAVRFADVPGTLYLMGFGEAPLLAARDLTHGVREAAYSVEHLPGDDAFYLFQGYLGERRVLPGRDGPPGAGYNTLPGLKPLETQLFVGYWRVGSHDDRARFERLAVRGGDRVAFAAAQREVFFANVACLERRGRVCR